MKFVYALDLVIVFGSIFSLIFLFGYVRPLVIAPLDDYESTGSEVLFSIEKADKLLIDDNIDFSTPEEFIIEDGLKIDLAPGKYYWKAVGILGSRVRTLTINSQIILKLRKSGEDYEVVNDGNVRLNVDVYNGTELVDKMKLDAGSNELSSGSKFVGEVDDE